MNLPSSPLGIAVALIGAVTVSIAGCASSDSSSAPSTSTSGTASVTASSSPPGCTKSGLADAATAAVQAISKDNTYSIDDVQCADGWAVTSGLWSSASNPNMGAPSTLVFQQQGQRWEAWMPSWIPPGGSRQ